MYVYKNEHLACAMLSTLMWVGGMMVERNCSVTAKFMQMNIVSRFRFFSSHNEFMNANCT